MINCEDLKEKTSENKIIVTENSNSEMKNPEENKIQEKKENEKSLPERNLKLAKNKKKIKKEEPDILFRRNISVVKREFGMDEEQQQDEIDALLNKSFDSIYVNLRKTLRKNNRMLIQNQPFVREYKKLKNKFSNNEENTNQINDKVEDDKKI